jgi:hypothetical protein
VVFFPRDDGEDFWAVALFVDARGFALASAFFAFELGLVFVCVLALAFGIDQLPRFENLPRSGSDLG